jgi:hypothetical protein
VNVFFCTDNARALQHDVSDSIGYAVVYTTRGEMLQMRTMRTQSIVTGVRIVFAVGVRGEMMRRT